MLVLIGAHMIGDNTTPDKLRSWLAEPSANFTRGELIAVIVLAVTFFSGSCDCKGGGGK